MYRRAGRIVTATLARRGTASTATVRPTATAPPKNENLLELFSDLEADVQTSDKVCFLAKVMVLEGAR